MVEKRVHSFTDLHNAISKYRKDNRWIFRGQSNVEWQLIPKAGREPFKNFSEESIFRPWQRKAHSFIEKIPENDLDWLALAQHHGLATRLLDWTYNPLAACYFAISDEINQDSVLYAYLSKFRVEKEIDNPFDFSGIRLVKPKGIASRIMNQSGLFTIHGPADLDLLKHPKSDGKIEKIIIDKAYKRECLFELSHYGYNELTLFPDLDGLSRHVNWHVSNRKYWRGQSAEIN